jgi:signal peptidase I
MGKTAMKPGRWIFGLSMALVAAVPLALMCVYFINPFGVHSRDPRQRITGYGPYRVAGQSMSPTLEMGQIVVVDAGYYRKHQPQRGDIVMYLISQKGQLWTHRVVGLPGETIAIENGVLLINGRRQVEAYVESAYTTSDYSWEMPAKIIPENSYFLMGDNRDNSMDSRMMGPIPRSDIAGKVVW